MASAHYADAATANGFIIGDEGPRRNAPLLAEPEKLSGRIGRRLQHLIDVSRAGKLGWALGVQAAIRAELDAILARHAAIALPVLPCVAPNPARRTSPIWSSPRWPARSTSPPSRVRPARPAAGLAPARVRPAGGPGGGEERLCGLAAALEAALAP